MAYIKIPTRTSSDVNAAADMNQAQLNLDCIWEQMCIVRMSSDFTVNATDGAVVIPFDTESADPLGWWNVSTYKFTPTVAGYYQVALAIHYNTVSSDGGYFVAYIYKNGTATVLSQIPAAGNVIQLQGTGIVGTVYCNGSSDYIQGFTSQQCRNGETNNLLKDYTEMTIRRIQ